jgi:hypothetical protein
LVANLLSAGAPAESAACRDSHGDQILKGALALSLLRFLQLLFQRGHQRV